MATKSESKRKAAQATPAQADPPAKGTARSGPSPKARTKGKT